MDIKLLEAFRAVVDLRSVTAAAKLLGVSQPAVSTQLARLEGILGFALFERAGGRLRPSAEGRLFYAEAAKALGSLDRLAETAAQIRTAQHGRLVVASHPSASIALLPPVVARFLAGRPGVQLRLLTRSSDVVTQLLPPESFDIGIAQPPVDPAAFKVRRHALRCVAILPHGHPAAVHDTVRPEHLSGAPAVSVSYARQTRLAVLAAFGDCGATWNGVADTELFASACGLVAAGAGFAIVDPLSAASYAGRYEIRAFAPAILYEVAVFHPREREPSRLAAAFLETLDEFAREIGAS